MLMLTVTSEYYDDGDDEDDYIAGNDWKMLA